MRTLSVAGRLLPLAALAGCIVIDAETIKSRAGGRLEVTVAFPSDDVTGADLYVDKDFVGTIGRDKQVLHLKRGRHRVRVEAAGCAPYERELSILGDPNPQVLTVTLQRQ